jgi:hypothetical protein
MTRTEILNKIDELETARFYLAMKDHWTREDFARDTEHHTEMRALKEMLNIEKEYVVEFIRPNTRNEEERYITLETFDDVEKAKEFGRKYQEENNETAKYTQKGYYTIRAIEKI